MTNIHVRAPSTRRTFGAPIDAYYNGRTGRIILNGTNFVTNLINFHNFNDTWPICVKVTCHCAAKML